MMSRTGHSPIKAMMRQTGALLAGDVSRHIYFADTYGGYDDGPYAALRLGCLVERTGVDLPGLIEALPTSTSTPEIRFACPDSRKFKIVARRLRMAEAAIVYIDGGSWSQLRGSNTEGARTARCEGRDAVGLDQAKHTLVAALRVAGLQINPAGLYAEPA